MQYIICCTLWHRSGFTRVSGIFSAIPRATQKDEAPDITDGTNVMHGTPVRMVVGRTKWHEKAQSWDNHYKAFPAMAPEYVYPAYNDEIPERELYDGMLAKKGETQTLDKSHTMYENNESETIYGNLDVKAYRSESVRGAEEVSVNVTSRIALFTSRIHMAVSKRSNIMIAQNIIIDSLVRFWLQNDVYQQAETKPAKRLTEGGVRRWPPRWQRRLWDSDIKLICSCGWRLTHCTW